MDEYQPWHRLFGLSWMDFFHGLPVTVEVEKDLSLKQQWLDVVIIRTDASPLPRRLPDGFEELGPHNLITFKSYQEALDGWTLHELCGHYANYRKQASPSMQDLLPEDDFRLFAVSVRCPQKLSQQVSLTPIRDGVYEISHFTGRLRLIVVHQLPREEHNAMLHLFSAQTELVKYGIDHYRQRSAETTSLLRQLYERYRQENLAMPYTLDDLVRDTIDDLVKTHPDEILKKLPVEKRLEGLSPEKRLEGLSPEKRLEGLSAEKRLEGLSASELIAGLSEETLEALRRQLKGNDSSS
jgi:hypothetical protein